MSNKTVEVVFADDTEFPEGIIDDFVEGCWALVVCEDGVIVELLGADGGEPEDQLLVRDWDWVKGLAERAIAAEARVERLERLLYEVREDVSNHGRFSEFEDLSGVTIDDVCDHILSLVHGYDKPESPQESAHMAAKQIRINSDFIAWLKKDNREDNDGN